jgi:hypothetical protein
MLFGHDWAFWLAATGAALVKLFTSQYQSFFRSCVTVAAAVFCAVVFTDAACDWFRLAPETYKVPMAALLALTGEALLRLALSLLDDPKRILDVIRAWRGK